MQKDDFRLDRNVRKRINSGFDPRDRAEDTDPANDARRMFERAARAGDVRHRPPLPPDSRRPRQSAYPPPARRAAVQRDRDAYDEYYDDEEESYEPPRRRKKHRLLKWGFRIAIVCVVVIFLNIMFFYYRGELWFNEPRKRDYPVRGAVVDEQLGKIDWEKMSGQNISFVYIRATKGTTENDEQYSRNRKAANHTDLLAGYYHEFDFRTDGEKQAEHFIDKLGDLGGKLRPMVKITRYGLYRVYLKDEEKVCAELDKFLSRLQSEYGRRCVIQCDKACYEKYIRGRFDDHTLWLISHYSEPNPEETDWALWDYNPRVRAAAYSNSKEYYCMTVYRQGKGIGNFRKNFLIEQ